MPTPTDGQFYDSYYTNGERALDNWAWIAPDGTAWVTRRYWAALFGEWPKETQERRRMVPDTSIPWVQHWFYRIGEQALEHLLERAAVRPILDLTAQTGPAHLLRIILQAAPMPERPREESAKPEPAPRAGPKEKKRKRELKRRGVDESQAYMGNTRH